MDPAITEERILREHQRRFDDHKDLQLRIDGVEKQIASLTTQVLHMESAVKIVTLEQGHVKDLFNARLATIDTALALQLAETKTISVNITQMASDVEKTPMGRQLHALIATVAMTVDEHSKKIGQHEQWENRVDGVLTLLKFLGAGGVLALVIAVLRMLHIVP